MKLKLCLATAFIFISSVTVFAHALWIETNAAGSIGKVHEIKILYGEYAAQEFEETEKWYSDVNNFALWLVSPDGSMKQLQYKPGNKHYTASFVPDKEGVYILKVSHSAKELDGSFMYQFNASAVVAVGVKTSAIPNASANNDLYLQHEKSSDGKQGRVKAFYKGKPAGKITITVSGPSGWSKNFETDENGVMQFELLWKGWYALEGTYIIEEKGNHFDKPYEQIWRCATTRMNFD
jgi:uncharacterized GH25 family protein